MVVGFHIQDDGTRVPMEYDDDRERTWCECSELLDHKHYAEAYKKLDEYHETNGGFINKNDWKFILKVEVGYLNVKPSAQNFKNCADAWNSAAFRDGGSNTEDLVVLAQEIIEHYERFHKIPVKFDDFDEASAKQTLQLLEFIYVSFLVPGADHSMNLDEYCDFLEPVVFGIRHLITKGEKKKARAFYEKVKGAGFGDYKRFMEERNPFE